jgi:hypothetical protein
MFFKSQALILSALLVSFGAFSQELLDGIQIHGNIDIYAQTYNEDSIIGAPLVPEKSGFNSFTNLIANKGNFSAGVRFESYLPPVQGFDERYGDQKVGVPYRFVNFTKEGLDITVGNFYEQFGTGMILRAYEERALGVDNAFDGVRVKYSPIDGLYLKAMAGNQRYYWEKSDGIVRAFDAEVQLNELIAKFSESKLRVALGGSYVSKFQSTGIASVVLPENVAAWSSRVQLNYKGFGFTGEYAYKVNDPSADNNYIYRPGQGLFLSGTYSRKGFGINISAKSIDNMAFRSDRQATINDLFINYLPALTRQHTYNLSSTLYPYATQPNGEIGLQADIIYKIKKGSKLGGKYGTTIQVNISAIQGHDTNRLSNPGELLSQVYLDKDPTRQGYETTLYSVGDETFYRDYNIEISRKLNKKVKLKGSYIHQQYNIDLIQGTASGSNVVADIAVMEGTFKLAKKHSIRAEAQHLWTQQDQGNWAFALIEYGYSPHWIITVLNQYNYGNSNKDLRVNYPTTQVTYIRNANRLSIGYGRQRAGIFCVGGVCRNVPAANGLTVAITSSF